MVGNLAKRKRVRKGESVRGDKFMGEQIETVAASCSGLLNWTERVKQTLLENK